MMYPWQPHSHPLHSPHSPMHVLPVMPANLARHPQLWTKDEVAAWLRFCSQEYSIDDVPSNKFDMNGRALCLLNRTDFMERVPRVGDILFNALQRLTKNDASMLYQHMSPYPSIHGSTPTPAIHVPRHNLSTNNLLVVPPTPTIFHSTRSQYVPIQPHPIRMGLHENHKDTTNIDMKVMHQLPDAVLSPSPSNADTESAKSDSDSLCAIDGSSENLDSIETVVSSHCFESNIEPSDQHHSRFIPIGHRPRESDCRLLWEFIHQLLNNESYKQYVSWENPTLLTFRINNPTGLAELWGYQKNRTNMTYEKLSRALRYYYKMDIIKKVPGKRLTYKFLQQPKDIKKGQRGARPHIRTSQEVSPDATTNIEHTPENEDIISVKQERTEGSPNVTSLARTNVSPSTDLRIKVENIHDEHYSNVDREYSSLVQEEPEDLSMKSSHNKVVTDLNINEDSYHHSRHFTSSIRCGVLQRTEPLS